MRESLKFEISVTKTLNKAGWRVEREKIIEGMAIGVFATQENKNKLAIECKSYSRLLGMRTAQDLAHKARFLQDSDPTLET